MSQLVLVVGAVESWNENEVLSALCYLEAVRLGVLS